MKRFLVFLVAMLLPLSAMAMTPMTDNEMSDVTGQLGLTLGLESGLDVNNGNIGLGLGPILGIGLDLNADIVNLAVGLDVDADVALGFGSGVQVDISNDGYDYADGHALLVTLTVDSLDANTTLSALGMQIPLNLSATDLDSDLWVDNINVGLTF